MTVLQSVRRKKRLPLLTLLYALSGAAGLLLPTHSDGASPGALQRMVVRGKIKTGEALVTREFIEKIGAEELHTETPFTNRPSTYSGIKLGRLIEELGAFGEDVSAIGDQRTSVGFSLSEAINHGAFLAFARDGVDLATQTQGPFWIVFPWSEEPSLQSRTTEAMAVRDLNQLIIE